MDVAATCMSVASAAVVASVRITQLVKEVRELQGDLELVRSELGSLGGILLLIAEQIRQISQENTVLTTILINRLKTDVEKCRVSVQETSDLVTKYGKGGLLKTTGWLCVGKGELAKLQGGLVTRKQDLNILLDLLTMSMTAMVETNTAQLLTSNEAIHEDVQAIVAGIQSLQEDHNKMAELLENLRTMATQQPDHFVLNNFLDNLTTYAESISGRSVIDPDELVQLFPNSPRNSFSASDAESISAGLEASSISTASTPQGGAAEKPAAAAAIDTNLPHGSPQDLSRATGTVRQSADPQTHLKSVEDQRDLDAQICCITAETSADELVALIQRGANFKGRRWKLGENPSLRETRPDVACINCFPLTNAVRAGNVACVKVLLGCGVDPGAISDTGPTNLFWAVYHAHPKIVSLLLEAGSNPNERNSDRSRSDVAAGHEPLQSCWPDCDWPDGYRERTALSTALKVRQKMAGESRVHHHPETAGIVSQLLKYKADPNERGVLQSGTDDKFSDATEHPICMALYGCDVNMVGLLATSGSRIPEHIENEQRHEMLGLHNFTMIRLALNRMCLSWTDPSSWIGAFVKKHPTLGNKCLLGVVRGLNRNEADVSAAPERLLRVAKELVKAGADPKYSEPVSYPSRGMFGSIKVEDVYDEKINALELVGRIWIPGVSGKSKALRKEMKSILRSG